MHHSFINRFITALLVVAFFAVRASAISTAPLDGGGEALVVSGTALADDEVDALNANTYAEVWKTGATKLVATGIGDFTGVVRVKEGVWRADAASGLGADAAVFHVTQGGSLYVSFALSAAKQIHLSGTGTGAYPALVKSGGGYVILDDDASFAALGNWISVASKLDMNGHVLTQDFCTEGKDGRSESVWPSAANVLNPGSVVLDSSISGKTAKMTFCYNSDQLQGSDHVLTVRNGLVDWYLSKKDCNWTLVLETDDCPVGYNGGSGGMKAGETFKWSGPIVVAEGKSLRLRPGPNNPVVISGPISGKGGIAFDAGASATAYLKGANTYTGPTKVSATGSLLFHGPASMPSKNADDYELSNGGAVTLRINGGTVEDGFAAADVAAIQSAFARKPASSTLQFAAAEGVAEMDFAPGVDDTIALGSYSNALFGLTGSVRLRTTFTENASFATRSQGALEMTAATPGAASTLSGITVRDGTLTLKDAGSIAFANPANAPLKIAGMRSNPARLVLEGDTHVGSLDSVNKTVWDDAAPVGIVEIGDGATLSNKVATDSGFAYGETAYGVIRQRGGLSLWAADDVYIGSGGGCAFVDVFGGDLRWRGSTHLGSTSAKTHTVVYLSGGVMRCVESGELQFGWGSGNGLLYQTGGVLVERSYDGAKVRVNSCNWSGPHANGSGTFIVADAGRSYVPNYGIWLTECTNGLGQVVLVDGGTLAARRVVRATKTGYYPSAPPGGVEGDQPIPFPEDYNGAYPSYVHFNGGVLQALFDVDDFLGKRTDESDSRPTEVVVYGKGAILDSSNRTVTVNAPLKAPAGDGVASIELTASADGKITAEQARVGWLGAPFVKIAGDGHGATAVALFDRATGEITGFRVTSPGWGYTTATAQLYGGGKEPSVVAKIGLTCTLAPNASGNLVKRGTGTVILNAANAYGGRTVLEDGTLKLGVADALPAGSAVELAGGVLNANGFAAPAAWKLDVAKVVARGAAFAYAGDLAFPAGASFELENAEEALEGRTTGLEVLAVSGTVTGAPAITGLGARWSAEWTGGKLRIGRLVGTAIIIR